MTLAKRLLLLTAISIGTVIVVAGLSYTNMQRVFVRANYANVSTVPRLLVLNHAQEAFMELRIRLYRHVLNADAAAMTNIESTINQSRSAVGQGLKDYASLISDAEDKRLLEAEQHLFDRYAGEIETVLVPSRLNKKEEALKQLNAHTELAKELKTALENHIVYNEKLGAQSAQAGADAIGAATWWSAGITVIAVLVVGFLSLQTRSTLMNQLGRATAIAQSVAAGDLSNHNAARDAGEDEIGQLIRALEKMRQDLADTIGHISASSDELASAALALSTTAQQVSDGSQNQASSTAASAAALEQLTVSIDQVGNHSDDAQHQASEAGTRAVESADGVGEAAARVDKVARRIDETAGHVELLSQQLQQIDSITQVIREVADQTNLLALNAAIEAARAGEQGRGFAVVADEVRNLAERTTASVHEISGVISTIHASVVTTVSSMQSNRAEVNEVVVAAQTASASMNGIRSSSESVASAIAGISAAMREQRAAANELSRNVEAIAQLSEQNSSAVASVAHTASNLVGVSNTLKFAIGRFKL